MLDSWFCFALNNYKTMMSTDTDMLSIIKCIKPPAQRESDRNILRERARERERKEERVFLVSTANPR